MKKSALMSAIALTSAFGLASCSSTEDDGNINPTFDGQSVKTQFAINIPRAAGNNGTRATADQTQGEGKNFLGIKNILLLPFSSAVTSPTQESLPIINTLEAIYPTDTDAPHKVYADVDIPTGTKNFLFYGYAMPPKNTSGDYITNPFITGAFQTENFDQVGNNDNYKAQPQDVSFQLKPVLNSKIDYTATTPAALLLALNNVVSNRVVLNDNTISLLKTDLQAGSLNSIKQILQRVYDQDVKGTNSEEGFKTAIASAFTINESDVLETKEGIDEFPRNLDLPDGIAKINYEEGTFSYQDKNIGMGNMTLDPTSITYPAPIVYWTNTDIRTKDSDESNWSSKFNSWTQDGNWSDWNNNNAGVSSSTIAVALKNQINYGVASLKLQVKCADNLTDHNGESVTIPSSGFKVTGLMIGNQPDGVDYKFETTTGETFAKTIFDRFEESNYLYAKKGEAQNTNYTIVLPSEKKSGTTKGGINFALELENDNDDFQGNDGIVPANGKFYLIGQMNPENGTLAGTNIADPAVFMSDYQTTLTVTITSLANAYNCIPDIRNTQQQLGLSVNLEWQKGYNFNINIGGNN